MCERVVVPVIGEVKLNLTDAIPRVTDAEHNSLQKQRGKVLDEVPFVVLGRREGHHRHPQLLQECCGLALLFCRESSAISFLGSFG